MMLREQLKADLILAMKARQKQVVSTIRILLAAIDNAEAVEPSETFSPVIGRTNDVPRRDLTEQQIRQILQIEADKQRDALTECERLGRDQAAKELQAELEVMSRYLSTENH